VTAPAPRPKSFVERYIEERVAQFKEAISTSGWEMALGTYVIPRLGILMLVVAIVFGLSLASRYGGPPTRVAFGYGVCAVLLGLAWRLEKTYPKYARVLYSGGFALSYFVTFATHYVPLARVIPRPEPTLALMAIVVAVWTAVAQIRRSRTIAVLVTFLGHLTVGLAILTTDNLANYSVAALIILAAGSAFFLLKNRWYYVAVLGVLGSYINHAIWMSQGEGSTVLDFSLAMGILASYLLIFALAELSAPEDLRRKKIPVWFRTTFVTLNTASFFTLATFLVAGFDFTRDHQDVFRFIYGGGLLLLGLAYLRLRKADPLFNVYVTKAVAVATLGLSARYSGNALAAWLAIETVVLLVSSRRSGLVITRLLAFGVGLITFFYALHAAQIMGALTYADPTYAMQLTGAGLTVLGFWIASQLYQRTDWSTRAPATLPLSMSARESLWQLDLLGERPPSARPKPLGGLLIPYVYGIMGTVLFLLFATRLVETGDSMPVLSLAALIVTGAAAAFASKPYGLASLAVATFAVLAGTAETAMAKTVGVTAAIVSLVALAAVAFSSEHGHIGKHEGLSFHQSRKAPCFLYASVAWLLGLLLMRELDTFHDKAALMVAGCVAAGLVLVLHPKALSLSAAGLLVWAGLAWFFLQPEDLAGWRWYGLGGGVVAVPLAVDRFWCQFGDRKVSPGARRVVVAAAWLFAMRCVWREAPLEPGDWTFLYWAAVSYAFLAYGLGFRSKTGALLSVLGAGLISGIILTVSYQTGLDVPPLVCAFVALAGFWVLCERLVSWAGDRFGAALPARVPAVLVGLATTLLVFLPCVIPEIADFYLTISWTVLALAVFGVSLAFRQKYYRYAGLTVFGLAVSRAIVIDVLMSGLEGMYKVAALAILGTVLLGVAYGYFKAMELFKGR
jgi:Predicted membrane protein (DUF2339)